MPIERLPETVSDLFPSPWLKAMDLQGRAVTVKISAVNVEELRQQDGTKAQKAVLTFLGKSKRLILNKTQAGGDRILVWVRAFGGLGRAAYTTRAGDGREPQNDDRHKPGAGCGVTGNGRKWPRKKGPDAAPDPSN